MELALALALQLPSVTIFCKRGHVTLEVHSPSFTGHECGTVHNPVYVHIEAKRTKLGVVRLERACEHGTANAVSLQAWVTFQRLLLYCATCTSYSTQPPCTVASSIQTHKASTNTARWQALYLNLELKHWKDLED